MFIRYEINASNLPLVNVVEIQFNSSARYDVEKQKEFYD
jgi:hypothetical protein